MIQGSGTIKAGFAGEEQPSCYIPSLSVFLCYLGLGTELMSVWVVRNILE